MNDLSEVPIQEPEISRRDWLQWLYLALVSVLMCSSLICKGLDHLLGWTARKGKLEHVVRGSEMPTGSATGSSKSSGTGLEPWCKYIWLLSDGVVVWLPYPTLSSNWCPVTTCEYPQFDGEYLGQIVNIGCGS